MLPTTMAWWRRALAHSVLVVTPLQTFWACTINTTGHFCVVVQSRLVARDGSGAVCAEIFVLVVGCL